MIRKPQIFMTVKDFKLTAICIEVNFIATSRQTDGCKFSLVCLDAVITFKLLNT